MSELVLYRKYRPKTFSQIVGQEHVVRTISNALKRARLAHAYLFIGQRGTGKTTTARLLAKAVNCLSRRSEVKADQSNQSHEPCNKCFACNEINQGRCLDLIEIDAASNRGVDEIRELREGIKFSPNVLKRKVFIIDEVHQLTKEAFNALLKTLEEPPAHALFILATTEGHKVPQTIISRCQRFDFYRLPLEKIVKRLDWIARQEKVSIEKPALRLIALNADGAVRDAESMLGQVMAACPQEPSAQADGRRVQDKDITLKEVQSILGVCDIQAVSSLVNFLLDKNNSQAILHINKMHNQGYDLGQFTKSLVDYLRKMMILKVDNSLAQLVAPELTKEQLSGILEQGNKIEQKDLTKLINLFLTAENELKYSDFPQLPLELAVVECCSGEPQTT